MTNSTPKQNLNQVSLCCGFHAVASVLARSMTSIAEVMIDVERKDKRSTKLKQALRAQSVSIRLVDRHELDRMSNGLRHQGVIAILLPQTDAQSPTIESVLDSLNHAPLLLVLDQVKDPHNLGACLRSAQSAGVDAVLLPKDRACPVNQTVRRVAAGAADRVKVIYVANLARTLLALKSRGIWLIGCTAQADKSIYDVDLSDGVALVLGAEDKGLRQLTQKYCDYLAWIPMVSEASSLNVSVACGVVLFEALRQRELKYTS